MTTFDRERFGEAILYLAGESEDDPRFGLTKLNKLLYFTDFKAFVMFGRPVTGATYRRLERGPVPAELLATLREMEQEGEVTVTDQTYFNLRQRRVRPLRVPDQSVFEKREVDLMDAVLWELKLLNASEVSALSHLEVGWQIARHGEEIPYYSAYLSDRKPTDDEVERRRQAIYGQRTDGPPGSPRLQ